MAIEVERKWLLDGRPDPASLDFIKAGSIIQAYLYDQDRSSVRVRSSVWVENHESSNEYSMAIKTPIDDLSRTELEIPIPGKVFQAFLDDDNTSLSIYKTRWVVNLHDGHVGEIDIYHNELEGLFTVEVEFDSLQEAKAFRAPKWFWKEVTGITQYLNSELAKNGWLFDNV